MKITKYPQSCLLVESDDVRILIDPGSFVAEKYSSSNFGSLDAILITHEHADHADSQLIASLATDDVMVVSNASSALLLGDVVTHIIEDKQEFLVNNTRVSAYDIPHVAMVNGNPGPQNTGYLIQDILFHPGDGIEPLGVLAAVVAAPIAGPDISPRDVYAFVKGTSAKKVIPIHYDYYKADPNLFGRLLAELQIETLVLSDTESVEI